MVATDVAIEFEIGDDSQIWMHQPDLFNDVFQNRAQKGFCQNVQLQSVVEARICEIENVVNEIAHAHGARLHETKNVTIVRVHTLRAI
jgi:hypothetical protein